MWLWLVVWQVALMIGSATSEVRVLSSRHTTSQYDCFDYPSDLQLKSLDTDWRFQKKYSRLFQSSTPKYTYNALPEFSRRLDLLPNSEDMVREHAKLVQDINSLRQVMFVAPLTDDTKDYEDSIFHEILETTSTTSRPRVTKSTRPKSGFPILLLGGSSNKHSVKSYPPKIQKQSISLVGSSVSPVARHPYPFVMAASSRQPVRICMSAQSYTTTHRPSFWERLVKSIIPR